MPPVYVHSARAEVSLQQN